MAFIVADSNNQPAWGGYTAYDVNNGAFDTQIKQQIAQVRSNGGNVMVSFGGASGQELAETITSVPALTAAYQSVINAYNLSAINFDIESAAVGDTSSIGRRSQAIAALQKNAAAQGKTLQVWFTLPVLPSGLTPDGLYVLQSALKYGVQIKGVNVMTMDYGEGRCRIHKDRWALTPSTPPKAYTANCRRCTAVPKRRSIVEHDRSHTDDRHERRHQRSLRFAGSPASSGFRQAERTGPHLNVVA